MTGTRLLFVGIEKFPSFHRVLQLANRRRHFWKNMECELLRPPSEVRGMQELQREAFKKCIRVPTLRVAEEQANKVMPLVKKLLLKMEQLRPVRAITADDNSTHREILLHPAPVKDWTSLPVAALEALKVQAKDFQYQELQLTYANWRADEIFKSVLPLEEEGLTSFSRIGHIVHLNLRDHLLPYRNLIGQVLCDKVPGCRTVVNKAANIDNTYRNFQLELICGEPDYQVETKENGIPFEFDFSRVYWNPRLSTEHERIVQLLHAGDVLYDVFAGVGPFSVPAGKKRCTVLANDLNPESFRWLQHNAKRNKSLSHMKLYNNDGRDFILRELKSDLLQRWRDTSGDKYHVHITMNLPAMAVEFLSAFRGLFEREASELQFPAPDFSYPTVHVYCFAKGEDTKQLAQQLVEEHLGLALVASQLHGIHFVRNVAPNKDMYRVSFELTEEILATPMIARKRKADATTSDEIVESAKVKCN